MGATQAFPLTEELSRNGAKAQPRPEPDGAPRSAAAPRAFARASADDVSPRTRVPALSRAVPSACGTLASLARGSAWIGRAKPATRAVAARKRPKSGTSLCTPSLQSRARGLVSLARGLHARTQIGKARSKPRLGCEGRGSAEAARADAKKAHAGRCQGDAPQRGRIETGETPQHR